MPGICENVDNIDCRTAGFELKWSNSFHCYFHLLGHKRMKKVGDDPEQELSSDQPVDSLQGKQN